MSDNLSGGSGGTSDESGQDHQDTSSFEFDPTKGGQTSERLYTAKEELSTEEISVFQEKLKELQSANIVGTSGIPYKTNAFSSIDAGVTLSGTATRTSEGVEIMEYTSKDDLKSINGKHIYPCASLIEFLLAINEKIVFRAGTSGGFSLNRGEMTAGGNGVNINDHVCGRGIDIFIIGKDENNLIDTGKKNVKDNKKAFDILLETLSSMDESSLPDLVVFDDRLSKEYGILSGSYEIDTNKSSGVNGIIQKNYKNLKKVDFHANAAHQNHFHIAFSPQRAGSYSDYFEETSSGTSSAYPAGLALAQIAEVPDLLTSRINSDEKIKDVDALYAALIGFGKFRPESAAIFCMLAERESHFGPGSFNGNLGTGDYSIGLWQINYFGNQKDIVKDITTYKVNSGGRTSSTAVVTEKVKAYQLLFKDYKKLGITGIQTAVEKMQEIYAAEGIGGGKKYADERLFNAATQIGILKQFVSAYVSNKALNKRGWYYTSWGEYSGAPQYGWIRDLKFQTAVDIYLRNNPDKKIEDLKNHCAPLVENMISKSGKLVYKRWLEGEVFSD